METSLDTSGSGEDTVIASAADTVDEMLRLKRLASAESSKKSRDKKKVEAERLKDELQRLKDEAQAKRLRHNESNLRSYHKLKGKKRKRESMGIGSNIGDVTPATPETGTMADASALLRNGVVLSPDDMKLIERSTSRRSRQTKKIARICMKENGEIAKRTQDAVGRNEDDFKGIVIQNAHNRANESSPPFSPLRVNTSTTNYASAPTNVANSFIPSPTYSPTSPVYISAARPPTPPRLPAYEFPDEMIAEESERDENDPMDGEGYEGTQNSKIPAASHKAQQDFSWLDDSDDDDDGGDRLFADI